MKENQDLENEYDREIDEMLSQYVIERPDEQKVNQTIENLRVFVPQKQKITSILFMNIKELIKMGIQRLSYIDSTFYVYNLLFFIVGLIYCVFLKGNPYTTLMTLSPFPFMLGLFEVFKGRDSMLFELELSCKYSAAQLLALKITITSIYNLVLTGSFVLIVSLSGTAWLLEELLIYWLVPFSVVSLIGLYLATKFRCATIVPPIFGVWIVLMFSFTRIPAIEQGFELISLPIAVILVFLSWFLIIHQVIRLRRGVTIESVY